MNKERLLIAEENFLNKFPGGFLHPEMQKIAKKHKMEKMTSFTKEIFSKDNFENPEVVLDNFLKVVSRSSMVSIFEKPRFKDFVFSLSAPEKFALVDALKERLHGNEQKGFERIVEILLKGKIAKWPVVSICPVYFRPAFDVFVKPTAVKGIIKHFELENLIYRSTPYWEFYAEFRKQINVMKKYVDSSLSTNNAAFTGFLMMSLEN